MKDSIPYEGMIGNKNAEKWTLKESIDLFYRAIGLSELKEKQIVRIGEKAKEVEAYKYDFIGELTRELDTYKEVFTYLAGKHKKEVKALHTKLLSNLEANCFYNGKKGNIKEASAIMNLKSNHHWTDRNDQTSGGEKIELRIGSVKVNRPDESYD